jgi:diguanylate cyclase (GGDEF)-like protein
MLDALFLGAGRVPVGDAVPGFVHRGGSLTKWPATRSSGHAPMASKVTIYCLSKLFNCWKMSSPIHAAWHTMVRQWRLWWGQSDHYGWLTSYLTARGLLVVSRWGIAGVTTALALMPLAMLRSPSGPDRLATDVASAAVTASGVAMATLWAARWPSRAQSKLFSVATSCLITVACLAQSDPLASLGGCMAFAVLGGYIAFFHTTPYMGFNFVVASATTVISAGRLLFTSADVVLAGCAAVLILVLNISVPLAIQILVHALGADVSRADRDPLTGLLNRRAFRRAVVDLITRHRWTDSYLTIIMIDLDRFKQLNDSHGHAAGDEALIAVAAALRDNCRATAAIGRVGGEEFLIADTFTSPNPGALTQRLCDMIAAIPYPFTASIGTCSSALRDIPANSELRSIAELVNGADAAMYAAKRAGGNRVRHS